MAGSASTVYITGTRHLTLLSDLIMAAIICSLSLPKLSCLSFLRCLDHLDGAIKPEQSSQSSVGVVIVVLCLCPIFCFGGGASYTMSWKDEGREREEPDGIFHAAPDIGLAK